MKALNSEHLYKILIQCVIFASPCFTWNQCFTLI